MRKRLQELRKSKKKGFTLVELLVVIAIIIVLMAILIPMLSKYIKNANDATDNANARAAYSAAAAWSANELADNGVVTNLAPGNAELEPYFGNIKSGAAISATVTSDGGITAATYKSPNGKTTKYPDK